MLKKYFPLIIFILLLTGCDLYEQDSYQEQYVVESYLVADQDLPQVRLSTTTPIDQTYVFEENAVNNADIEIHLLDNNGNAEETYNYELDTPGIYLPENPETVLPERSYRLTINFPEEDQQLTAETLVPGSFQTVGEVVDSIPYQSEDQITITTTRSFYPNRQTYFIFTVNSVDPDNNQLTPFYRDLVENQNSDRSEFAINSSGIINEKNYDFNEDNTITLRLPWLAVAFYGKNDIVANAIDDNMYDFLRSQEVQTGGSTLPPGEIQNVIYNVEGGIGIFGSLASDTNRVFIENPFE